MSETPKDQREVIKRLRALREGAPRSEERAQAGRERFIAQIEALGPPNPNDKERAERSKGIFPAWSWARATVLGLVFLVVSGTSVAFAAQAALPNDILFPLKTAIEAAQLALEPDRARDAQLLLLFSQRRVDEIEALTKLGREDALPIAVELYRSSIAQVSMIVMDHQAEGHPAGQSLLADLADALLAHEGVVNQLIEGDPELAETDLGSILTIAEGLTNDEDREDREGDEDEGPEQAEAEIVLLTPAQGQAGRTLNLRIEGRNTQFDAASEVRFEPGADIQILSVQVVGPEELVVHILIAADAQDGELEVFVLSDGERVGGESFEIVTADGEPQGSEDDGEGEETGEGEEEPGEVGEDEGEEKGDDEDDSEASGEDDEGSEDEEEDEDEDQANDEGEEGDEDDEQEDEEETS